MGEVGYKDKKEHINFVSVECRERRVLQKETYCFVRALLTPIKGSENLIVEEFWIKAEALLKSQTSVKLGIKEVRDHW